MLGRAVSLTYHFSHVLQGPPSRSCVCEEDPRRFAKEEKCGTGVRKGNIHLAVKPGYQMRFLVEIFKGVPS